MRKGGGSLVAIVILIFAFLTFPLLLTAFDGMAQRETTTSASISTSGGQTTGNITLGYALYADNTDSVTLISSSIPTEYPAALAYNSISKILTVSGLTESSTRTLTVTYNTDRGDSYISSISGVLPFLILIVFILIAVAIGWRSWS